MTDTESVKKVFEKACKLGLSQVAGIEIHDEDEEKNILDATDGPKFPFCCSVL